MKSTTRTRYSSSLLFPLLVLPVMAQGLPDANLVSLLPTDHALKGWIRKGSSRNYKGEDLFKYINGGADIFLEYGFNALVTQEYAQEEKALVVDIYRMQDSLAAFGIYSFNRDSHLPPVPVGNESTRSSYQISFWQKNFFVLIRSFQEHESTDVSMAAFARAISSRMGKKGRMPKILQELPVSNRVPRSEKLFRGIIALNNLYYVSSENIFQLYTKDSGLIAEYKFPDDQFKLLIIKYESESRAKQAFERLFANIRERFEKTGKSTRSSGDKFLIRDRETRLYMGQRKGLVLALAMGGQKQTNAAAILKEIQ